MFHQDFSCRGEPGIGFDYEFSLRCWQHGYQVGLTDFNFDYQAAKGPGGTRASPAMFRLRKQIDLRNWRHIRTMYYTSTGFYTKQEDKLSKRHYSDGRLIGVQRLVTRANDALLNVESSES
ncbi:hypothetical protein CYMTET_11476 [Cymbomonas tetramitiformis]|uniref:Uncharacterized protein n=1 Tax=Cymbomonas tetramitiformis TaxID=36881 RepID=A0AAE0GMH4_9CHLO|nr:hypothetical protein CYMTET_11476 [Cymbomonas tetramitiformis]